MKPSKAVPPLHINVIEFITIQPTLLVYEIYTKLVEPIYYIVGDKLEDI